MLLQPYLNDLTCYQRLGEVAVLLADGRFQHYRVARLRRAGERLLLQLDGCVSREMAQLLAGSELCVRREELTEDGDCLGRVEEFFPTGSNEVLVVRKGEQEVLLPFTKEVIRTVDMRQGIMQVRAIPGLL